jgi:hypothetical protein
MKTNEPEFRMDGDRRETRDREPCAKKAVPAAKSASRPTDGFNIA